MPTNTLAIPGVLSDAEGDKIPSSNFAMRYTLIYALAALTSSGSNYDGFFGQQRINGRTIWQEP